MLYFEPHVLRFFKWLLQILKLSKQFLKIFNSCSNLRKMNLNTPHKWKNSCFVSEKIDNFKKISILNRNFRVNNGHQVCQLQSLGAQIHLLKTFLRIFFYACHFSQKQISSSSLRKFSIFFFFFHPKNVGGSNSAGTGRYKNSSQIWTTNCLYLQKISPECFCDA